MNRRFSMMVAAFVLAIAFIASPTGPVAADIADGKYEINYEMKEASSENTSIADGYFTKPATLTVQDGVKYIQLTVTSSSMIKSLSAPSGPVEVISEDEANETRTVRFRVDSDLSQPLSMDMHIIVPDSEEMPGGYDMEHVARAFFDVDSMKEIGGTTSTSESADDGAAETGGDVENPQTGDRTPITLYVVLLLGSVVLFTVYKVRAARE